MKGLKRFIKERDEALLSLDKQKILTFCTKNMVPVPEDETVFWAGIHKSILHINSATKEQKKASFNWLLVHGFKPYLGG